MSDLFEQYPLMSEYHQTSDGMTFYKEEPAKVYARTLKDPAVTTVKRSDWEAAAEAGNKPETAKEIFMKIPDMNLEEAQLYLDSENESEKPRVSVTGPLEKRIAELQKPA